MSNIAVLRQSKNDIAQKAPLVAAQLRNAEAAIDTTISQIAALTSMLIDVRMQSKLSAVTGQDVLSSLGEAMHIMVQGRASLVQAHNHLAITGEKLRLNPTSYGGMENKPV